MAAADRFAGVRDEQLVHVISFLPVRDAARTAVLARRWRPLWLRTGTINLDSTSYRRQTYSYYGDDAIDGERLFADAYDALAATTTSPARRLSLFMEANSEKSCDASLGIETRGWYRNDDYNRLQYLLAEPSLRELEEIRVGFRFPNDSNLHLNYKVKLVLRQEFLPWAHNLRVEVYAPRLRSFSYSGRYCFLWKFLGIFRGTKALKLQLLHMEHLVADEGELDEPLPVLHGLERLELEVPQDPDCRKDSAAAIATLLRQCPVIHHCRLRFSEAYSWRRRNETDARPEFDVSVDLFNKRESKEIALMVEGDGDDSSSVPDLPGLTGCRFSCLQSHLKYVKLQFELKRLNCFEVCLAKFFAENCKVLEVLQIEDGDQHFLSHINRMVERWRLNALNQSDSM
ncbi:unnamed protein product [Urochloa decumbens]|uniref:F-box protein n=1 Tax=Urochloa decumbens TaxID=240449 RepID=A0ABC8WT96_9POAL